MNITPHVNPLPIATAVNPPTDNLRLENAHRPVITAPTQTSGSPAEKGAADKQKSADQPNEQLNFTELQKSAEKNANQIAENSGQGNQDNNSESNQEGEQAQTGNGEEDNAEATNETVEAEQHAKEIQQLQLRDQEVRTHEMAHAAVGGTFAGAPSYTYETGPDNKKYAVAGEVSISVSPIEGDPEATIDKMEQVHAAALAPAEPSAQDRKVAAQASQIMAQARVDLTSEKLGLDDNEQQNQSGEASSSNSDIFNTEVSSEEQSQLFDTQINQTLKAQEQVAPSISNEVKARAERIEGYYSNIIQAHEKEPSHQFELSV